MEDLLEKECIVIASKRDLLNLCYRYRIPNENISKDMQMLHDHTKYAFVVSNDGVKEVDDSTPPELVVFKSLEALKYYLFKRELFNSKIVVYKEDYQTYLQTIRLLRKIGVKVIKDKTYFEEADHFYVSCGCFKEVSYFGCKSIVSIKKGLEFKASNFLLALKDFVKNKKEYKKHITYYQREVSECL